MKQEWKPDEMRASAEEIRGAIMPKSVTPEMVGGTLLGLVNAVGEVVEVLGEIPREHVKVVVNGYDGSNRVSGAGATVWLDVFTTKGFPAVSLPRQGLTADENGVVEFDVPHGFKYAVFSQIDGLSASFQIVGNAAGVSRKIELWNFPVGIFALGYCDIGNNGEAEDGSDYSTREVPFVTSAVSDDISELQEEAKWDIDEEKGDYSEGYDYIGILVSTPDTSFVITPNSKSEEKMKWVKARGYGSLLLGIPAINYHTERGKYTGDYDEAVVRARADMDGNMNTAMILDFCTEPTAALFAAASDYFYTGQRFLPSVGQLYLMWLNRTAINSFMTDFNELGIFGGEFALLPVIIKGTTSTWTHYESWWSSTTFDEYCSWVVNYNGHIYDSFKDSANVVRAVSAIHFDV